MKRREQFGLVFSWCALHSSWFSFLSVGSMWVQCGRYLQSVSLLSVAQMKIQSYGSSSGIVLQKAQAFWMEPLQQNELSFEAAYVPPTALKNLTNSLKKNKTKHAYFSHHSRWGPFIPIFSSLTGSLTNWKFFNKELKSKKRACKEAAQAALCIPISSKLLLDLQVEKPKNWSEACHRVIDRRAGHIS